MTEERRIVADPAHLVNTTFDDLYAVDAFLGRGGMGIVYRARHLMLEDVVALKLMPSDIGVRPDALRRFMREGRAARRFRHPNAVAVHDLRIARDGTPYLVLEYVPGWTLRVEMKARGRFDLRDALAIVEPIASVLDAAHAAGVVHRDLKPENVMLVDDVDGDRAVKVLDLGLAKIYERATDRDPEASLAGAILGTPYYMSPEQWGAPPRDGNPHVDGRSDLYSLGIVAYELLAGTHPFPVDRIADIRRHHVAVRPPPLRGLAPGLPAAAERAVLRALAKDRADRQRTAGELATELRAALASDSAFDSPYMVTVVESAEEPAPRGVLTNVPWPITAFVGRPRELEECRTLLARSRLVTLVGPGGVGKTRLAIETAVRSGGEYPDGVWFVGLDELGDPMLVPSALATALGLERAVGGTDTLETIRDHLADRRALVVLDNCEHLVDAAAEIVAALLRSGPNIRVLATSREPLGVAGEAIYRVLPLPLPDDGGAGLAGAAASDAVRLFVERAGLASPGFTLTEENAGAVAALCRRLDGIPLALELAAGCLRTLPLEPLVARLEARFDMPSVTQRGVPERQRTLRGAIGWGHAMLSDEEQTLLRRLSVFAGGWDLEAVESICTDDGDDAIEIADRLARLVDASFVVAEPRGSELRYRMLDTIRRYAAERLAASDEEARRVERHRDWYLDLAARAFPELKTSHAPEWHDRLAAELDNFRAVLARCDERGEAPAEALRLCALLERFWFVRGHWSEGRRAIARALRAAVDAPDTIRADALNAAGHLAANEGDLEEAIALYEEGLALRRKGADRRAIASSIHNIAVSVYNLGDAARAEALHTESQALYAEIGDRQGNGAALLSLGVMAAARGDYDRAAEQTEEALVIFRELDEERSAGLALVNLAQIHGWRGDYATSRTYADECLALANAIGFKVLAAGALEILGTVALETGELALARSLLVEALGSHVELGNRFGMASSFERLSFVAASAGEAERALRLVSVSSRLNPQSGRPAPELAMLERYIAPVRASADAAAVDAAERWAAATDTSAAVAYALER